MRVGRPLCFPAQVVLTSRFPAGGEERLAYVCKIDMNLYRCIAENICEDEVIITDKQVEHIRKRHGSDYDQYARHLASALREPDYILRDKRPNTAIILKEVETGLKLVLRLKTTSDREEYKNSIITFQKVEKKRYLRYTRNADILYKREGLR